MSYSTHSFSYSQQIFIEQLLCAWDLKGIKYTCIFKSMSGEGTPWPKGWMFSGRIWYQWNFPDATKISHHRQMSAQSVQKGPVLCGYPALKLAKMRRTRDCILNSQYLPASPFLSTPSSPWIWSYTLPAVFFVVFSSSPSWGEGRPLPLISSYHPHPILPSTRFHSSLMLF